LSRPGGNVTGVSFLGDLLVSKQLEILGEVVPKALSIGFLVNPSNANVDLDVREAQTTANALGRQLVVARTAAESDLDSTFATLVQRQIGGFAVDPDPLLNSWRDQLITLAARHTLPAVYPLREFVIAGGLMAYGTSLTDGFRQAGVYAARILRGEKPSELPVMQSTKVELVINLKTAKAAWSHCTASAAWPRRRSDRITRVLLHRRWSLVGT
jgi:putative ABC transport system substrate-binding protein